MRDLKYITLAQVIGCLLVILGHSYPFVTDIPRVVEDGKSFIYLFHMPLFVFCSGFLFAHTKQTERKTFMVFVGQRARRLLIPYFSLSLIGILPKYLFSSVLNDSLQLDMMSLIRAFLVPRENIWGHFWFLPMCFFMGCIAYIVEIFAPKKLDRKALWGAISLILIIVSAFYRPTEGMKWFGVNDLAIYGWSYSLGIETYLLWGDLKEKILMSPYKLTAFSLAGAGISLIISSLCGMETALRIVVAVLMITAILLLCVAWEDKVSINRQSLIAQTYQIFILSWPCQLVVEIVLERILHLDWWIILSSVLFTGVVGPLIIIKLVEEIESKTKTKILSLMIGK